MKGQPDASDVWGVIRDSSDSDMKRLLDIWLEASVRAHGFVEPGFWESQVGAMRSRGHMMNAKARVRKRFESWLGHPRFPLLTALIGSLLAFPALRGTIELDDLVHRAILLGYWPTTHVLLDLFAFMPASDSAPGSFLTFAFTPGGSIRTYRSLSFGRISRNPRAGLPPMAQRLRPATPPIVSSGTRRGCFWSPSSTSVSNPRQPLPASQHCYSRWKTLTA